MWSKPAIGLKKRLNKSLGAEYGFGRCLALGEGRAKDLEQTKLWLSRQLKKATKTLRRC